ncbi:hypothetical protein [Salinisphaera sp. T5B8]|uniref:hypothetical protein n=1 Tax=Salinisphaera sp. T5B8 TaxID=1304154 RepID=UPI00333E6DE1
MVQKMPSLLSVRPRRGCYAGFAMVAVVALIVSGCGSDDESTSGPDDTTSNAEASSGFVDADTIRERVIGNTVTGTMSPDSAYTEFYAPDGTIHGPSYEARWTIKDDQLCFDYDEALQIDCYRVKIDGRSLEWHRQGEVQGKGTLVEGNPNNF